jgi:hypothetical protein
MQVFFKGAYLQINMQHIIRIMLQEAINLQIIVKKI